MEYPKGFYRTYGNLVAEFDGEGNYTYVYSKYHMSQDTYKVRYQGWWPKRFNSEWEPITKLEAYLLGVENGI
jgi:hypothetical protein